MQQALESPEITPWQAGPFRQQTHELLFGAMHEDSAIELESFAPFSRVFCIASAGCTARALAAVRHEVTAVDINPQQILYAHARAAGAPMREGAIERLLSRARTLFPVLGWTETRRRQFLSMRDPADQIRYWQQTLDTKRWRISVDTVLSPGLIGLVYAGSLVASLPRNFGSIVRARLQRTWRNHPNNSNPHARRFFLGECEPITEPPTPAIRFACADAAAYLEGCKPASFDGFTLSNITDGAPSSYVERLFRGVKRAGTPGAVVVTRSFAEPAPAMNNNLAARDRSMFWGTVLVTKAENLCSTF